MGTAGELVSMTDALKDPAVKADPYPTYREFQQRGPFLPTVFGGLLVTRHAECFTMLRDNRFSSSNRHQAGYSQLVAIAEQVGFGELITMMDRVMLFADPPDHTRLRRIVGKAFTQRTVEEMRGRIGAFVDARIDAALDAGSMEIVDDLAFPLPVTVISEMLGVPLEDQQQLRAWTAAAVKLLDPNDDVMALIPAGESVGQMRDYFDALVAERRRAPGDDLLTALIAAEDEGQHLSHDELLDTMILLYGAGHETTVNLISGGVLNLLRHPDQLALLREDPTLIGSAVEELLRFGPPVQVSARTATTDVDFNGQHIEQGQQCVVMIAAANRDPDVFADPDVLDITRTDNRHLAFGGGIHLCLGAPLARIEGQEAILRLVQRIPSLALADDEIEWKPTQTIRGPASLNLTW